MDKKVARVLTSLRFGTWKRGWSWVIKDPRILTVLLGTQEIAHITYKQAPVELRPSAPLTSDTLTFLDSQAKPYRYDLSTIRREGGKWLHLSIRVSERFTAQIDCLVNDTATASAKRGVGVRFQPMYLPECPTDPSELVGKGLFFRGLHYPGWVTPGNVSLMCCCDYCAASFSLQSFHAGFSHELYFYCDSGIHTLVVPDGVAGAPPLTSTTDPDVVMKFDTRLPRCDRCDGYFKYYNPLRCPNCQKPYIDFLRYPGQRPIEYYGNVFYGDKPQRWTPDVD